jgi:hypothetical protein
MADQEETQNQNATSDQLKFAIPEKGYGVYLKGILPRDQRVLAGAFSTSMLQIKNIEQVQIEKFAQAAYSNENMFGLNLVNGTDVPTDVRLARISQDVCAVGGGVYGTFTMSNFYGAMSGLPYPLKEIDKLINELQTENLANIYKNLYLAINWEQATATVEYTTYTGPAPSYQTYYHITGVSITNNGGGYLRNGATTPSITINGGSGASATLNMGTDPNSVGAVGSGDYGKVLSATLISAGTDTTTPPSAIISAPPGIDPAVDNTGYNAIIQGYIDDANSEILNITTSSPTNFEKTNMLNTYWDITGKALKQEQRARYISTAPVPVPWDKWVATFPQSHYIFVDAIPTLAANTLPHMYVQTLEHISDLNFAGGQSIVALMRESRNEERLNRAGLQLDDNLKNDLTPQEKVTLLVNNTLPGALDGINGYTIPSFTEQSVPVSYYDPCTGALMCYNETVYVESDPIASIMGSPSGELNDPPLDTLPETPYGYEPPLGPEVLPSGSDVVVPDTSFPCEGTRVEPIYGAQPSPVATTKIGVGAAVLCDPPVDYPVGVNQPPEIIPPNLDAELMPILPSAPTVEQAIDQVIKCNCDCWVA